MDQIVNNDTWDLVLRHKDNNVKGTKWLFRNKMNEKGEVVRNRARLVCKGYSQQEDIEYEETYAPISKMKVVRMFLAYVEHKKFKVYQMYVKSPFLNGELEEEVYIGQPKGFTLSEDKDIVCKINKDLYGLKQAPRTWYAKLENLGYAKGMGDSNLYLKEFENGFLIIVIFVDDIIFRVYVEASDKFVEEMKN